MPDYPASIQSGTGLKKSNDAGSSPVPVLMHSVRHFLGPVLDWDDGCRNADAGVSFLNADAHLCLYTGTIDAYSEATIFKQKNS
jgi:hypothetical protein